MLDYKVWEPLIESKIIDLNRLIALKEQAQPKEDTGSALDVIVGPTGHMTDVETELIEVG